MRGDYQIPKVPLIRMQATQDSPIRTLRCKLSRCLKLKSRLASLFQRRLQAQTRNTRNNKNDMMLITSNHHQSNLISFASGSSRSSSSWQRYPEATAQASTSKHKQAQASTSKHKRAGCTPWANRPDAKAPSASPLGLRLWHWEPLWQLPFSNQVQRAWHSPNDLSAEGRAI